MLAQPDYSDKVDDPIATALRQLQAELRVVSATNKARKLRLAERARDRLAYQEYLELRDSIDKNITATYTKLQKKDMPKPTKKKKSKDRDRGQEEETPVNIPMPSALGLGPDYDNNLVVPDQLRDLVETRRKWVDDVGSIFRTKQEENPGRIWGIPDSPVFEGIEEEVKATIGSQSVLPVLLPMNGKGKGKASAPTRAGSEMDVG
jgi:transcriptional adapter 3